MSIQKIYILRLLVYEVSDGKAATEESVDKGILKELNGYEKQLLLLCFALRREHTNSYLLEILW